MRLEFESNASSVPQVNVNPTESDDQATFSELLNSGVKAAQTGDRLKARKLLMSAVEIDQYSENAWLWLASISEYPEELLVFLNNVLDINPENERALQWSASTKTLLSKTLVQRGVDANEDGRREFAMQCFDQALSYDERNVTAWLWLASLADSESRKMEYLRHVLMLEPQNEVAKSAIKAVETESRSTLLAGAAKSAVAGDAQNALAILDNVEARWPDNHELWVMRSHLVVAFEDKMTAWSRILEFDPNDKYAASSLDSLRSIIEAAKATSNNTDEGANKATAVHDDHEMAAADDHAVPTHELPPLESVLANASREDELLASEEIAPEPVAEPAKEEWASPWQSPAEPKDDVIEFDFPTVDAFSLPAEVVEGFSNGHQYSSDAGASDADWTEHVELDSFDQSYEMQSNVSTDPFESPAEPLIVEPVMDDRVRILVVDDSATARKLVAGKLEQSGYSVLCAENGREAMALSRESVPALVLVDIAMPMMDGYAVCRALRDDPGMQNVPVVMISGKDGYFDEDRGAAAGASGFIMKPFGPETLMKTVEVYLAGAAPNK